MNYWLLLFPVEESLAGLVAHLEAYLAPARHAAGARLLRIEMILSRAARYDLAVLGKPKALGK